MRRTEIFGRLLSVKEDGYELARLTEDVLAAQVGRPEGWILGSMYAVIKEEHDNALTLVDKVL